MATTKQIRAARALLGWSQADLADRAVLSENAVQRLESGETDARSSTTEALMKTLEAAGIAFVAKDGYEGVMVRTSPVRKKRRRDVRP